MPHSSIVWQYANSGAPTAEFRTTDDLILQIDLYYKKKVLDGI
jgi:hypothetical protein